MITSCLLKKFLKSSFTVKTLRIKLCKAYHNIAQKIFSYLFIRNNNSDNIRAKFDFVIPHIKTAFKGSNSVRYNGPVI